MGSVVDVTQTQADWMTGTLTDVIATSNNTLELEKGYLDDYSTNPLTDNRFTGLTGTWVYDISNKWIKQTDSSTNQKWGVQTASPFSNSVHYKFNFCIESDPSNRIHAGAFIQTVSGQVTGFRITHLDHGWVFSKWTNNSEVGLSSTKYNYKQIVVGTTYLVEIFHDFTTNNGSLYVDGDLTLSWSDASWTQGRPGYHNYGNVTHYDNLIDYNLVKSQTGNRISPQINLQPVGQVVSSSIKWQRGNEYFDVVGGWHPDTVALGAIDGFGDVHKITKTSNYDDIFTNQFTTSDFPNYAGPGKYAYMEFWAKWDELPTFEGVITKLVCPPPDPNKYQKYVLKSDGQYSRNEYFRIYYNTNQNDGATAYIADPIVYLDTVDIETRHSLDGGLTWTSWTKCTNGEPVPNLPYGTVTTAGLLECRQTLTTQDPSITPKLSNLIISVKGMENTFFMFPF